MKKNFVLFAFLISTFALISVFICGCADNHADLRKRLKTSYTEWIDYLAPAFDDGLKIIEYSEENGKLYMEVERLDYKSSTDSFGELITLHNKFAEDNPGYFTDNKIEIDYHGGGQKIYGFSSSIYDTYHFLPNFEGDRKSLELNEDGKLIYLWTYYAELDNLTNYNDKEFLSDVGLLYIETGTNIYNRDSAEKWAILDDFPSLEKLVLNTSFEYNSDDVFYKAIEEAKPGLEIITAEYGKNLFSMEISEDKPTETIEEETTSFSGEEDIDE